MATFGGPADWWTDGTDAGRKHIATKGIVQNGLVLNLDAGVSDSYPGSGNTWTDLSGNGYNATLVNGVSHSNKFFSFDGSNDYINLNRQFTLNKSNGTLEFIVNRDTTSLRTFLINSANDLRNMIEFNTSNIRTETQNNCNTFNSPTFEFSTNKWYVFTVRFVNSKSYWHVNGEYVGETPNYGSNDCGSPTNQLLDNFKFRYIGLYSRYSSYYDGKLGSFKIYNRALTQQEILQNFNATRGRFGI